ncbi:MAG: adenine deaminase [Bacillota bacterium]
MIKQPENRSRLIKAALGEIPFDLVIKNIKLVNVFTEEIYPAEIGIYGGYIAHVEPYPDQKGENSALKGEKIFEGRGLYASPGFIDSHVHIESSLMNPANFAATVLPRGTTTVITDPHEIANVLGLEGVRYMLESSQQLPMNQFVLAPSCVPSAPDFESGGANFGSDEIAEIISWEGVLGLAEVMDYPGVIHNNDRMKSILEMALKEDVFIQGHSPGLGGRELSAYLCAGPRSDHEITETEEAREKIRAGMTVDARESSISQDLKNLIPVFKDRPLPPNFTLCTDDREPDDLLAEGQMNHVIQRAIEEGLSPLQAIKSATYQSAREIGINNLGALAPGYEADIVLLSSLEKVEVEDVFFRGQLVAQKEELVTNIPSRKKPLEKKNTVFLNQLSKEDFKIKVPENKKKITAHTINYPAPDTLFTELGTTEIEIKNGCLDLTERDDINLLAVFNRYPDNDNVSRGLICDFGLKKGAVASTVSHDCHNLTVAASNPQDAAIAANAVIEAGGGIGCAESGELKALLKLPIAGLMSSADPKKIVAEVKKVKTVLRNLGLKDSHPLLKISTLTLAVIPEVKITDRGIVDVNNQQFIPLFTE